MLKGPNVDATADIIDAVPANVIASGGVTSLADVIDFDSKSVPVGRL